MIRVLTQVGVYMHTIQLENYCILLFSNLYPTSIFVANEYFWNFVIETALCKITLQDLAANLVCLFFFEYMDLMSLSTLLHLDLRHTDIKSMFCKVCFFTNV